MMIQAQQNNHRGVHVCVCTCMHICVSVCVPGEAAYPADCCLSVSSPAQRLSGPTLPPAPPCPSPSPPPDSPCPPRTPCGRGCAPGGRRGLWGGWVPRCTPRCPSGWPRLGWWTRQTGSCWTVKRNPEQLKSAGSQPGRDWGCLTRLALVPGAEFSTSQLKGCGFDSQDLMSVWCGHQPSIEKRPRHQILEAKPGIRHLMLQFVIMWVCWLGYRSNRNDFIYHHYYCFWSFHKSDMIHLRDKLKKGELGHITRLYIRTQISNLRGMKTHKLADNFFISFFGMAP